MHNCCLMVNHSCVSRLFDHEVAAFWMKNLWLLCDFLVVGGGRLRRRGGGRLLSVGAECSSRLRLLHHSVPTVTQRSASGWKPALSPASPPLFYRAKISFNSFNSCAFVMVVGVKWNNGVRPRCFILDEKTVSNATKRSSVLLKTYVLMSKTRLTVFLDKRT